VRFGSALQKSSGSKSGGALGFGVGQVNGGGDAITRVITGASLSTVGGGVSMSSPVSVKMSGISDMANYFPIDSAKFESFLQGLGFTRTVSHNEVVYERAHKSEPALKTKVYTSSRTGAESARDVGKDAIRIISILQKEGSDKSYPIFRGARVYRTTSQKSVEDRTAERIEEAETRCDQWLAERASKRFVPQHTEENCQPCADAGEYFGKLGETVRLTLTVKDKTPWRDKFVFVMHDDVGHVFTFWSEKQVLIVGETYDMSARIRGFRTWDGVRQTNLVDCKGKRVVQ